MTVKKAKGADVLAVLRSKVAAAHANIAARANGSDFWEGYREWLYFSIRTLKDEAAARRSPSAPRVSPRGKKEKLGGKGGR